jgi:HD-GYP domain-containing protein (c-di-GMP phosphodiesterase class II)
LSVSFGIATAYNSEELLKQAYKRADDLMYREKLYLGTSARNKIVNALLAALSERDHLTEGHGRHLQHLCRTLGEKMGLSRQQLANLALLAQVHDIGKVGIPDRILFKRGPLTEEEWEIMRQHPEKGYRIALASPDLAGIADLILKHHEKWDGTGYPLGLKGEEIPIECRILAIADAFDAMTSDRPYRKAKTVEEALEEIRRCARLDPLKLDN